MDWHATPNPCTTHQSTTCFGFAMSAILPKRERNVDSRYKREYIGLPFRRLGDGQASQNHVAGIPGLGIKHVKGQPLIVHGQIQEAWIGMPHQTLVQPINPQLVLGLQCQRFFQKGKEMLIAGTKENISASRSAGSGTVKRPKITSRAYQAWASNMLKVNH